MGTCTNCGCNPCSCQPSVLNRPQIIGGVFDGPTINGPTINGGQANNLNLVGAQVDCTSRGCTAGVGVCDAGIATNAQVCASIAAAISSGNAAFCAAVENCLSGDPAALCPAVATCIATTPGIINSTSVFGLNARATTALYGVVRYATIGEFNNGNCLVAVDPCTLISALQTPSLASPFWLAFTGAVCSAGSGCFAPLNSPAFTGDPTAPTPPSGDNDTSIATTAFVTTAINNAISSTNTAFCAAVNACVSISPPSCASITALFPAAGGAPPNTTRFLGTDCLSYTAAQIAAAGGGGGGGSSGGGCTMGLTTFTGPHRNGSPVDNTGLWIGPDDSAGAGAAQCFAVLPAICSSTGFQTVGGLWIVITNAQAQTARAGGCPNITFQSICGESGVQS